MNPVLQIQNYEFRKGNMTHFFILFFPDASKYGRRRNTRLGEFKNKMIAITREGGGWGKFFLMYQSELNYILMFYHVSFFSYNGLIGYINRQLK